MRRLALTTAAIVAAVFLFLLASIPAGPGVAGGVDRLDDDVRARTLAGAVHVHSTRSDGTGSADGIAAAAGRAGLRFVVIADHGDATRPPDPPAYRHGVLVIDAVEISTTGGHYVALDMPAAPYPLGGDPEAVVEDVRRLGGFGIVAHPDSMKPELKWTDWSVAVDGVEWLNLDSEWRDESAARLARVPFDYMVRPGPALASLLDRPERTLERWSKLASNRPVVALAAHDAHGGTAEGEGPRGFGWLFRIPSYEAAFLAFAMRAIVQSAPTGAADADARLILDAIRGGRIFSAIDAVAGPALVDFRATAGSALPVMGQSVRFAAGATLSVRSTLPAGGRVVLLRSGGAIIAESSSGALVAAANGPGAYRVEVLAPASPGSPPVPWILTNPIYLSVPEEESGSASPAPTPIPLAAVDGGGAIEKDPLSAATLTRSGRIYEVDYALRAGERESQYVALALPMPKVSSAIDALSFTAKASAPMRVSVQLRFSDAGAARWGRSVYLSRESHKLEIPLNRLKAVDGQLPAPSFESASSILFVVDLTNASPGQGGRFELSDVVLTGR
jgi:hypothetical protein